MWASQTFISYIRVHISTTYPSQYWTHSIFLNKQTLHAQTVHLRTHTNLQTNTTIPPSGSVNTNASATTIHNTYLFLSFSLMVQLTHHIPVQQSLPETLLYPAIVMIGMGRWRWGRFRRTTQYLRSSAFTQHNQHMEKGERWRREEGGGAAL